MKLKEKIYRLVEKGSHGRKINLIFDYVIISLIFLSIVSIILESIKEIGSDFRLFLKWFDIFSVLIFSIEYILRLYVEEINHPSTSKFK